MKAVEAADGPRIERITQIYVEHPIRLQTDAIFYIFVNISNFRAIRGPSASL